MRLPEFIKKIKLESPHQSDVLIFDVTGSDFLSRHVLYGIDHHILHTRQEFFYCGLKVILQTILNINVTNLVKSKKIVSEFYKSYLLGCLQCIKPKVVLTVINNEPTFHWLSRAYTNASFYAIQNGFLVINNSWDYTDSDLKKIAVFGGNGYANCVTNFICFGENDEAFYRKYGAKIDNYYPVGSLRGSYYKYALQQDPPEVKYTLCLVSQYRKTIYDGQEFPHLKKSMKTMETFLKQFVEETSVSLCIAAASQSTDEYEHFQRTFGESATVIIKNDPSNFSTYRAMDESRVVISNFSAAAIEAFGWGKKIFLCNYTDNPLYSFTILNLCMTDRADYSIFKERLLKLIKMDHQTFLNETRDKQKYIMNYDPDFPVNEYIRRIVLKHLRGNSDLSCNDV
jgi:surface carbohydrate biosynthesis protein